ncbi:MAG: hypothetical protein SCARUB_03187 [Candidatus Scalindua rubra]|uniref:Uncharacterized protein n=1 Tax=Candidatus Scalindua rubra TaxID=1872076 RepID=A0A1E3X806_9BACT|nr:MAG: hypothetical protein SCARUB_03187 [Candidatus Scalindua rubra]
MVKMIEERKRIRKKLSKKMSLKKRMKRRVYIMLATTFFCIGIAALISIGTSNVYAVTGRIVIYIFSGGLLIFIVFLFMYQMIIGKRRMR